MAEKSAIQSWFMSLQDEICSAIEETDKGGAFYQDVWQHHTGGGGRTRILQKGNIIEKGGVNFSAVFGAMNEEKAKALNLPKAGDFLATGVSIVMHPKNPNVPIIHMNIRYFEMEDGTYWFGGGIDLTPHYVNKEQAIFFHKTLKETCQKTHPNFYHHYKIWADDYFFLPHRQETRGVGGIFFDRLEENESKISKSKLWEFVQNVGKSFAPIYTTLMKENAKTPYGDREKHWQLLRRSRYVEFNLLYDRGTKFGIETQGRTESILMSLPPAAIWEYAYQPEPNSKEAETLNYLRKGINWCD